MKIVTRAARFDLCIDQAAQAGGEGRKARRKHFRITDYGRIRLQPGAICWDKFFNVLSADLFFTFDQKLDIDGEFTFAFEKSFYSLQQNIGLPFVV